MLQDGESPIKVNTVPVVGGAGELEPQLRNSNAASANNKKTPSKRLNINSLLLPRGQGYPQPLPIDLMFTSLCEVRQIAGLEPCCEMAQIRVRVIRNKALRGSIP
jgi:hypothetical protein